MQLWIPDPNPNPNPNADREVSVHTAPALDDDNLFLVEKMEAWINQTLSEVLTVTLTLVLTVILPATLIGGA